MSHLLIAPLVLLFLQLSNCSPALAKPNSPVEQQNNQVSYTLGFQRWGDFGSYHLGMKVTMLEGGKPTATWFMNGGWDTTFAHDTLLVYQIPVLFPVFLRAYVHPTHPTSPLFNIRKWEDFGQIQSISSETAMRLITHSHNGMTNINKGDFMYSPIVKPFKLGNAGFWTSNSYVASLVHWANETGTNILPPEGGKYPGLDGPFLPKSVFESQK
jgi:hypothetical protein